MVNLKERYQHGGNIYEINQRPILDFSANINPLGIPSRIEKLLIQRVKDLIHYPDPKARGLTAELADYWKVSEENVLVGNGSTELIYLILNVFRSDKVIIPVPCFTEYERAAEISGNQVRFIPMPENKDFSLDFKQVNHCDTLFICNPNNPTGNLIISNRGNIKNISAKRIIIDEAFMDFVLDEKKHTFIPEAVCSKKIVVLRTLTKFFALPGLRAGYLIAHRDIVRELKKNQIPWSVNGLAQIAAQQCLRENKFIQRSKRLIEKERDFLYDQFNRLKEFRPYLPAANFLLIKIKNKQFISAYLKEQLLKKGILIRDCANFRGLNNQFIRVAVRTREENMRLVQALKECVCSKN